MRNSIICIVTATVAVLLASNCSDAASDAPESSIMEVTANSLRLRTEPSRQGDTVESLPRHTVLVLRERTGNTETIDGTSGEWVRIETLNASQGFVFDGHLRLLPKRDSLEGFQFGPESICGENAGQDVCSEGEEAEIIAASGEIFKREPGVLTIATESGDKLTFQDNQGRGEHDVNVEYFELLAYIAARKIAVLQVSQYEGGYVLLVHTASGQRRTVWAPPLFSSDHDFLAVCSASLAHNPNGVQIIRVGDSETSMAFEEQMPKLPVDCRWEDQHLSLKLVSVTPEGYAIQHARMDTAGGIQLTAD